MPVSVVQRENAAKPVVGLDRSPRRVAPASVQSLPEPTLAASAPPTDAAREGADAKRPDRLRSRRDKREAARQAESVPADLRAQLEPMLGANLSDVAVHRGPATARAASDLQARAFTVDSEVHLPDKLGPTSHGEGRETLAHELTHVVQQRRLGAVKPDESSSSGEAMEAEARTVARRVAGSQRVSVAAPPARRPTVAMVHSARPPDPAAPQQPTSSLSFDQQRSMAAQIEDTAMSSGIATRIPNGGIAFGGTSPSASMAASAVGAQREPERSNAAVATPVAGPSPPSEDPLSPEKLDELATRLYDGIQSRLRRDLLLQRERSGSLFDRR